MVRFDFFGIPVTITPGFWIGSAILGGGLSSGPDQLQLVLLWVACVFVSTFLHELGHALATLSRGGMSTAVELYAFGGLTRLLGRRPTRREGFFISLAGPLVGLIFGAAVYAAKTWLYPDAPKHGLMFEEQPDWNRIGLNFLLYMNVAWTLVNLLPIMPLDGGHMLN